MNFKLAIFLTVLLASPALAQSVDEDDSFCTRCQREAVVELKALNEKVERLETALSQIVNTMSQPKPKSPFFLGNVFGDKGLTPTEPDSRVIALRQCRRIGYTNFTAGQFTPQQLRGGNGMFKHEIIVPSKSAEVVCFNGT